MVKLEWGTKRSCQACSARFYDLLRSPILCPKCGTTFEIQTSGRGRRSRLSADSIKDVGLDNSLLIEGIDLVDDSAQSLEDDNSLIEDTSDLGEDLDDIPDVLDHDSKDD